MEYYQYLLYLFVFIQLTWAHGIHHDHEEEDNDNEKYIYDPNKEKTYPVSATLGGTLAILYCSFVGTLLPIIFRDKYSIKVGGLFFNCLKLFGTGVILSVAFIHMVIPAGKILISKYTFEIFNETYTSFAGVFVILGIIITHFIQVYTSHTLYENLHNQNQKFLSFKSSNISNVSSTSVALSINEENSNEEKDITVVEKYHKMNNKKEYISTVDEYAEKQHGILHLMEDKEKQIICYLLEIGISIHSILIGIAYGMRRDEGLLVLMVALVFHQFFEGVSLSSVFLEAKFKRANAIIIMIIVYTLTLPFGAIIGLIIRNVIESTDKVYLTTQGIIDAVAGGILIYDDLVNILSKHCNSKLFKNGSFLRKNIQLISFYCGIVVMAIIGIWT